MKNNNFEVLMWDYNDQPDFAELTALLGKFHKPVISPVPDTQSDQFAVVISEAPASGQNIPTNETQATFDAWWSEMSQGR